VTNIQVGRNNIHYEQVGEGPNLFLLPTLLAEMSVYDDVIDDLASQFRVTRINFPGFGSSTGPIKQSIAAYANLVAETITTLCLPIETNIIGNGFGGFVACTLAIHHGTIFNKLVLVDSGPGFPESAKETLRILAKKASEQGMVAVLDAAIKRMFPEDFIARNPSVVKIRQNHLAQADPELFANAALGLTSLDNRPKLAEINNPTLIVVGLADETTPPSLSYELHAGISGSGLVELPGVGHCPQLQDPPAFLKAVVPFLQP
jgi:3-oxoadipate enol-lactonase